MLHGKEIYIFFAIYGINGIIGIIISQILISLIIFKVLDICKNTKVENYTELVEYISKNKKINRVIKIIINTFLLISFYVMVAGFSAYFAQELGISNIIGTLIIIILCYITFMKDIDGIIKINTVLMPILILFILFLSSKNLEVFSNVDEKIINTSKIVAIYKAILYASYNSITLVPIVTTLKKYIKNKKQIILVSILVSIILISVAIAIYGLILKVDIDINSLELPTVYVAGMNGKIYKYLYGGVILVAIFTSAISAGYSILENYIGNKKKYKKISILICVSALFVSNIGFSNLINVLYPAFGILGIMQVIGLLSRN